MARIRSAPCLLALCVLFGQATGSGVGRPARVAPAAPAVAAHFAGWAMDVYPGDSEARIESEMRRQIDAGATIVWLGHDNPGEVDARKREPGLAYAVWAAYRDPGAPRHGDGVAMVRAQIRALDAARALGVRVVLPIGYQTQMGSAWNLVHPGSARRLADGSAYNGPDPTNIGASFLAPDYRHDIIAYYHWVDTTFVRPYSHTILMLNLADEPKEGDYSIWADRAFRSGRGYGLHDAGADPKRQLAVGRFESGYVADYAAWSARQWQAIDPSVRVTMSFDGGYSRYMHEGPDLEALFDATPSNFEVTFDAFPRDGLYDTPLRETDLIELFLLVRSLGHYSHLYHRPLWLWSAANSWGLNEASSDPGTIADAVANGMYLAQLARQTGGDLYGIAVWNYNIRGQGLYDDTHHTTYNPDEMFRRVSAALPLLRRIMAAPGGAVTTAILAPNEPALRQAGAALALRASDSYRWSALAAIARSDLAAVVVTHLAGDRDLARVRTVVVLARSLDDLAPGDREEIGAILERAGTIVAAAPVARALAGAGAAVRRVAGGGEPRLDVYREVLRHGVVFGVSGGPVERLFLDANSAWAASTWRVVLRRPAAGTGYAVTDGGFTLLYSIAPGGSWLTPAPVRGARIIAISRYDSDGGAITAAAPPTRTGAIAIFVARRTYTLVRWSRTVSGG